jgi:hypothetical protein
MQILRAAGRQGVDEIGMALKAFPDSIQAHEPGQLFTPLPSEVAQQGREPPGESYLGKLLARSSPDRDAKKSKEQEKDRDNDLERD